MAFILTIVYIVVTIISPEQYGKEWASYHVLTYLAVFTVVASLPSLRFCKNWKSSVQTFLLFGFIVAIGLSHVVHGWLGGVLESWRTFLPSAAVFFFIIVNVTTPRKLKIVTLAAAAACLFVCIEALCGYYMGYKGEIFILWNNIYSAQDEVIGQLSRIRGAGFLSDPNDFAQILLIAVPLTFVAWQKGRHVANFVFVLVPVSIFLWTTYLTHSRGGLIALTAIALLVGRKKLGTSASMVLTCSFILGMLALDFTGGRGISAADGADRLEAWANGLEMFKSAPLFGIGFNNFTDYHDVTAHNSFVLCLAELGLLGSVLWVGLLVTTITSFNRIVSMQEVKRPKRSLGLFHLFEAGYINSAAALADPVLAYSGGGAIAFQDATAYVHEASAAVTVATTQAAETTTATETTADTPDRILLPKHWNVAIRLALVSFMISSWFLSRSYTTTMYLVLGLATATVALQQPPDHSPDRGHWIFTTIAAESILIVLIYALVRFRH